MVSKALRVDGGGGDDDLEVRAARQDLFEVAQQKVDVEAAFVGLVDDDGVVGLQQRVGLGFGQQNAVGHELDRGVAAEPVLESHLEAHHLAQRGFQLFGNALGHAGGSNAPRLGVTNQARALPRRVVELAPPHRQRDLGQLRGFARSGLATDNDDLMRLQRSHDLVALARHRQRFRKVNLQGAGSQRSNFVENRRLSPPAS